MSQAFSVSEALMISGLYALPLVMCLHCRLHAVTNSWHNQALVHSDIPQLPLPHVQLFVLVHSTASFPTIFIAAHV